MISAMKRRANWRTRVRGAGLAMWFLAVSFLASRSEGRAPGSANSNVDPSLAASRALEDKIQLLSEGSSSVQKTFQPIVVTELEANSYLKYHGREFLPPGVIDPKIQLTAEQVSGVADVDFNQLNQHLENADDWQSRVITWIFKGKQRVSAVGKLETANGQVKVTLTNVTVGNLDLPSWLVDWALETYVQERYKIDLTKPLMLPSHVTHIVLAAGQATFYRSANKTK